MIERTAQTRDPGSFQRRPDTLEHVPKKLLDFFDSDMFQRFDFELRPYRSKDSI